MQEEYFEVAKKIFPFAEYKKFQIENQKKLIELNSCLWEAPTGFGKTVLAITSQLPALLDPNHPLKQIFIFVRTKTQVFRILDECNKISNKVFENYERKIISLPLIAKDELCVHEHKNTITSVNCTVLKCTKRELKLENDQLKSKLVNKLFIEEINKSNDFIEIIHGIKELQNHCPYYTLLPLVKNADIIITTHAWLTHSKLKNILLKEFDFQTVQNKGIILDEVHNFKASNTAELQARVIDDLLNQSDYKLDTYSKKFLMNFKEYILNVVKSSQHYMNPFFTDKNSWYIESLIQDYNQLLNAGKQMWKYFAVIRNISEVISFLEANYDIWYWDRKDVIINKEKKSVLCIVKAIVFPSKLFDKLKYASKSIYMSGTLYPLSVYKKLFNLDQFKTLGVEREAQKIQHLIFSDTRLASKYKQRTDNLYLVLSMLVYEFHKINTFGHTLVFNTSKKFTKNLERSMKNYLIAKKDTREIFVESNSIGNQVLIDMLRYRENEIIIATLGGGFSEGIEIKDPITKQSKIKLIIITGIPFPPPNVEYNLLHKLYAHYYGGEKIADLFLKDLLVYQKIEQAAGRGIRSHDIDYCAVICTDYRLMNYNIWNNSIISSNLNHLTKELSGFYERNNANAHKIEKLVKINEKSIRIIQNKDDSFKKSSFLP